METQRAGIEAEEPMSEELAEQLDAIEQALNECNPVLQTAANAFLEDLKK